MKVGMAYMYLLVSMKRRKCSESGMKAETGNRKVNSNQENQVDTEKSNNNNKSYIGNIYLQLKKKMAMRME